MERYSVFQKLADGASLWVCDADKFDDAVAMMQQLARESGREHFIHDFRNGDVVATSNGTSKSA
jgi:threonine dehydratase